MHIKITLQCITEISVHHVWTASKSICKVLFSYINTVKNNTVTALLWINNNTLLPARQES